ncbi:MAG: SDR family oxidoreductase [Myxococcota bacterium]|nr:SDR family oxidoreductase [Myxococcota bacterium]
MKILVAGAAGYLGQSLIQVLAGRGHEVLGLDVREGPLAKLAQHLKESLVVDLTQPEALRGRLDGVQVVISTVGLELPRKDLSYWDIDYTANLHLLKEAERAGVKKFLYVSVIRADAEGDVPPLIHAKREFERELRSSKLQWVIFRPTSYFKDIVNIFLNVARTGTIRLVGTGAMKVNPLHPLDFSEFIVDHLDTVNEVLEVGGPDLMTYKQLGQLAFDVLQQPARFSYMSPGELRAIIMVKKLFKPVLVPLFQFTLWCTTRDMVAPQIGKRRIHEALAQAAK